MTKYLDARIGVRYWEDTVLNGAEDKDKNISCIKDDIWNPIIDLETGIITNWKSGDTASVHYKSADCNSFYLLDENKNIITEELEGYVIDTMCPADNGFGDYVIMNIDKDGLIDNFINLIEADQFVKLDN